MFGDVLDVKSMEEDINYWLFQVVMVIVNAWLIMNDDNYETDKD